ncbi:hypothetical protein RND71_019705 [Anisodus tanguticus]|uniref:Pectinesterase n=1 Tax=Anisodus tanguticus TaxID=243964 RepID=A0AAE1S108_9SOLA|nr:hypothetical protein RND71_019705 [Anisodus tanguticus]
MVILWWSAGNCLTFDSTVAQDGSGNYKTITEAPKAAPNKRSKLHFIHVKRGTYNENVTISSNKTNIALVVVGDGVGVTIITASKSGKRFPTPSTGTLGSAFFRECEVYGTIDFIFGGGQAIFRNSAVYARTPLLGQGIRILAPGAYRASSSELYNIPCVGF